MHEEQLLRDLARKVGEVVRSEGGQRVARVRLWVGALAHLSPDQLRGRWPEAAAGTGAEDAELIVERSEDLDDPRAQQVVLTSLDLSEP